MVLSGPGAARLKLRSEAMSVICSAWLLVTSESVHSVDSSQMQKMTVVSIPPTNSAASMNAPLAPRGLPCLSTDHHPICKDHQHFDRSSVATTRLLSDRRLLLCLCSGFSIQGLWLPAVSSACVGVHCQLHLHSTETCLKNVDATVPGIWNEAVQEANTAKSPTGLQSTLTLCYL